jgi:outer membrane protein TolC
MMNLRAGSLALLLLVTGYGAWAQADTSGTNHAFSIQQCVEYARKHNVQVKNALLDYQIQQQTNRQITSAAYPQLNGSLGTTYYPNVPVQVFPNFIAMATYGVLENEGVKDGNGVPIKSPSDFGFIQAAFGTKWSATGSVSLSQVLFDGQVFVGLQARQASLDAQMKAAEITEENIKVNIYKVYYQLVVSKSQMEMLDANIARSRKLESDTKALFENGFREKLDVDRASVQLANLETEKLKTQRNIDNGYTGLKFLIGMSVTDSLTLTDNITDEKIREGILEASNYKYSDRKEYQSLEITQSLREYNIKRYKYAALPSAKLSSSYAKNAYRDQFNFFGKGDWYAAWNIGLNISIPIFDGFSRIANVRKAELEYKQTQNLLENMKLSIDNDVVQAQNRFKAAITTLDYQRRNMQLAEQVYDQTKKKFESGLASNTDITNTQTDLISAQTNYVNALYDAIIARVDFSKATGTLP